ncbi:MAG: hypothetical protein H7316_17565 [Tardiphaga sp.]|uniref:hypothetical protein n=1 Tax=unclassified Tardiphaga TaxID=2631404 RepID=UPI00143CD81B|nr:MULTISPECIES: hypothetical protein [unclassified Tardiphaga]MBC7585557.1 hypothetical protein [Tardiphaga sp.]
MRRSRLALREQARRKVDDVRTALSLVLVGGIPGRGQEKILHADCDIVERARRN